MCSALYRELTRGGGNPQFLRGRESDGGRFGGSVVGVGSPCASLT